MASTLHANNGESASATRGFVCNKKRATLGVASIVAITFFNVSGGVFGGEEIVSTCGPFYGLLAVVLFSLVVSVPVILVTSELSSALPHDGGYSIWVTEAFGEFWGIQESFWSLTSGVIDNAVYPVLVVDIIRQSFPGLLLHASHAQVYMMRLLFATVFTVPNIVSLKSVGQLLQVMFVIVIVPSFLMVAIASSDDGHDLKFERIYEARAEPNFRGLLTVLFWNLNGYDCISTCAGEIAQPGRNIPRGLFIACAVIVVTYVVPLAVAVAWSGRSDAYFQESHSHISWRKWTDGSLSAIADQIGGAGLAAVMMLCALVGNFGQYCSEMLEDSYQLFGMAHTNLAPECFGRLNGVTKTPVNSIAFLFCIIACLIAFDFSSLLVIDNFFSCLSLVLEMSAVIQLRRVAPESVLHRPYAIPIGTCGLVLLLLPFYLVTGMVLLNEISKSTLHFITCLVGILAGIGFFSIYERRKKRSPEKRYQSPLLRGGSDGEYARNATSCWTDPVFRKAILVLVDGLRYDFVAGTKDAEDTKDSDSDLPYVGQMHVMRRILREQPRKSLLYRFVADPPTVTMQRLKGILTGGLPTFIDVRNNFASAEITEDNIIDQLRASGRRLVFMGDDTWIKLFPGRFVRSYPYPSFNVKDLDTVDEGIADHLVPEMQRTDWDVIIAHTLGIDHVGHRFGPLHPIMGEKLRRTDRLLAEVVKNMDDETILVVFGDHGMTEDGNHGGATSEETGAALFLYSKGNELYDDETYATRPAKDFEVSQVDLVPTLSLLLGVPIPFGSLGTLLRELRYDRSGDRTAYARGLQINAAQVWTYLNTYASVAGTFSSQSMEELARAFEREGPNEHGNDSDPHSRRVSKNLAFLRSALSMCRAQWTAFDWKLILGGLTTMMIACVALVIIGTEDRNESRLGTAVFDPDNRRGIEYHVAVGTLLGLCVSVTSNSYVEAAPETVAFLLSTLILVFGVCSLRRRVARPSTAARILASIVVSLASIRGATEYLIYRKSVGPLGCSETPSFMGSLLPLCAIWVVFSAVPTLRSESVDRVRVLRVGCVAAVFALTWMHWSAEVVEGEASSSLFEPETSSIALPRIVVATSLFTAFLLPTVCSSFAHDDAGSRLMCLVPIAILSLGPNSPLVTLLVLISGAAMIEIVSCRCADGIGGISTFMIGLTWFLLGCHGFFVTGHSSEFASLQHSCGFVGLHEFHLVFSPAWVLLNTVVSPCGAAAALPILADTLRASRAAKSGRSILNSLKLVVGLCSASLSLATAATAALHSRHLMVWAIFAPKFVAESSLALCVMAVLGFVRG
eukprot:g632.t1